MADDAITDPHPFLNSISNDKLLRPDKFESFYQGQLPLLRANPLLQSKDENGLRQYAAILLMKDLNMRELQHMKRR